MHKALVNRLGGLSLPRKSVVGLTDRPDMTLDVYRGRKTTIQQHRSKHVFNEDFICKTITGSKSIFETPLALLWLEICYRNSLCCKQVIAHLFSLELLGILDVKLFKYYKETPWPITHFIDFKISRFYYRLLPLLGH